MERIETVWGKLAEEFIKDDYFAKITVRSYQLIKEFIGNVAPDNGPILEIGAYCGYNVIALKELGYESHAVDLPEIVAQSSIRNNCDKYNIPFHPYRAGKREIVPYPDNFFGGILLIEVLEHLNTNPLYLFSEIKRVLKPGGMLLLTTPNQVRLWGRVKVLIGKSLNDDPLRLVKSFNQEDGTDDSGYHWKLYTAKEIEFLTSSVGLSIKSINYRWGPDTTDDNFLKYFLKKTEKIAGLFSPSFRDWIVIWSYKS